MESLNAALNSHVKTHPRCPLRGKGLARHSCAQRHICLPTLFHFSWPDDHYPVNMLRNVAQQNVVTDWLMALDIDVVPSSCMSTFAKVRYRVGLLKHLDRLHGCTPLSCSRL